MPEPPKSEWSEKDHTLPEVVEEKIGQLPDFFKRFGLDWDEGCKMEDNALRKLALPLKAKLHPDKNAQSKLAAWRFMLISEAHDALTTKKDRKAYRAKLEKAQKKIRKNGGEFSKRKRSDSSESSDSSSSDPRWSKRRKTKKARKADAPEAAPYAAQWENPYAPPPRSLSPRRSYSRSFSRGRSFSRERRSFSRDRPRSFSRERRSFSRDRRSFSGERPRSFSRERRSFSRERRSFSQDRRSRSRSLSRSVDGEDYQPEPRRAEPLHTDPLHAEYAGRGLSRSPSGSRSRSPLRDQGWGAEQRSPYRSWSRSRSLEADLRHSRHDLADLAREPDEAELLSPYSNGGKGDGGYTGDGYKGDGYKGDGGYKGDAGYKGDGGYKGAPAKGKSGKKDSKGGKGSKGEKGSKASKGEKGGKGDKGDKGGKGGKEGKPTGFEKGEKGKGKGKPSVKAGEKGGNKGKKGIAPPPVTPQPPAPRLPPAAYLAAGMKGKGKGKGKGSAPVVSGALPRVPPGVVPMRGAAPAAAPTPPKQPKAGIKEQEAFARALADPRTPAKMRERIMKILEATG